MTKTANFVVAIFAAFLLLTISSCGTKKETKAHVESDKTVSTGGASGVQTPPQPAQLPVRYQTPGYITTNVSSDDGLGGTTSEYQIKVGATIRSTSGPQPLWEVIKRLVNLKGMTVSWANDVDQTTPVDVDISATDNFYDAIANLLRQADYFHEVKDKNIIVRNKATKVYQLGIPAMQGGYTSTVGGNFLSNKDAASGTEGSVKITSADNKFDIWLNVEANLKVILQTLEAERKESVAQATSESNIGGKPTENASVKGVANKVADVKNKSDEKEKPQRSNNTARDGSTFIIDKSVGLITVTAKPNTLKAVDDYINNLKKQLYKQVNIEAKIIEVFLQDNSKIGLDWSSVLKDKSVLGTVSFGNAGQVYPHNNNNPTNYANTFVSRVMIPDISFEVFLNALNEQGDSHVLANPKLTVLNGQPAIISVGKDVAYVKQVTAETDSETNTVTYSAEVGNVVQGIALGVMATIRDDKTVVLHLTPITTDLENLTAEGDIPVTTVGVGPGAVQLGLPKVKVREMSTMVEVQNGEMLIIGGLIDSIEGKTGAFAPGLGSIPVVKYLFGVEEKTLQKRELVILLTPKII
ncbi:pilus (MSHA type) biogenesis protein MshL [uncultured Desulfobulbus sp.]|uniref:pilus (MSHA type) biogenesis protein MshL n=1 Tax=uncultured Desulfobulbus sp. TaxID=239745 RepID=UPI0029C7303F|nr:pilus (MSHA type) biogenesis protein MshL [uncultured Desulfobulbus sp.]